MKLLHLNKNPGNSFNLKNPHLNWLFVLLYASLIFLLSSISSPPVPISFRFSDKILHFFEYSFLSILLCRAFFYSWPALSAKKLIAMAAVAALLYGLSDEIHQSFVPGRYCDMYDLLFDGLGGMAGALFWFSSFGRKH